MQKLVVGVLALAAVALTGCQPVMCIRNVTCVEMCGGPVVHDAGCGSCPAGLIDELDCRADAGGDAG